MLLFTGDGILEFIDKNWVLIADLGRKVYAFGELPDVRFKSFILLIFDLILCLEEKKKNLNLNK